MFFRKTNIVTTYKQTLLILSNKYVCVFNTYINIKNIPKGKGAISITLPSTGYYLVSAFINITTQQANDEYHAKITQGPNILTGTVDYYAAEGFLSMSTVVNASSGLTVLIQCDNSAGAGGSAVGSYSVVKLSN